MSTVYTGNLVKINGAVIPGIKSYTIGRNKLWKDSDRNMSGDVRGTLIGIFPKIKMSVGVTTEEEMSTLTTLLDQDYFTVEWFDVRVRKAVSAKYYASDYEVSLLSKSRGLYNEFEVSLVPVSKRRYS